MRQKSLEEEAVGRQAGDDQRRQHGGGAGHRGDLDAALQRLGHQLEAGVGDQRRAGVGDQRQRRAGLEPRDEMRAHHMGVVLVIGDERRRDPVMGEQRLGDARVLGDDGVGRRQRRQRAEGDVLQIADRRRDEMQARRDLLRLRAQAESGIGRRRAASSSSLMAIAPSPPMRPF